MNLKPGDIVRILPNDEGGEGCLATVSRITETGVNVDVTGFGQPPTRGYFLPAECLSAIQDAKL